MHQVNALKELVISKESELFHNASEHVVRPERLQRFINAFDGDVQVASDFYIAMLQWRQTSKVDDLWNQLQNKECKQSNFPHYERVRACGAYGPWYAAGYSSKGEPIQLEILGNIDSKVLFSTMKSQELYEYYMAFLETRTFLMDEQSFREKRNVRCVEVYDLSQFGIRYLNDMDCVRTLKDCISTGTRNYPESTSRIIFVNTPKSFSAFWPIIKILLRPQTIRKIEFLDSKYHRNLIKEGIHDCRVIHRLDKMIRLKDLSFVESGPEDDFLPKQEILSVSIAARDVQERFLWISRGPQRSSVTIRVSVPTTDGSAPTTRYEPGASWLYVAEDGTIREDAVILSLIEDQTWQFLFPEENMPMSIESGFLVLRLENNISWVYALVVQLDINFS